MSARPKIVFGLVIPLIAASGLLYLAGRNPRWLPASLIALSVALLLAALRSKSSRS